jgi:hypothetical protein
VRHLLKGDRRIAEGRDKLRDFLCQFFARTPPVRHRYRTGFFADGRKLIWEYPRQTPDGDQMDFVESMEIENGLIRRHCVYRGRFGVKVLDENHYWR